MELSKSEKALLARCFLFRSLTEEQQEAVIGHMTRQTFQKGEAIYSQHHFQKSLGILLEGEAVVHKESGALLNQLHPGSCFGAAALFAPTEEYVTTITARKSCQVLFISNEELSRLFRQYPDMALDYIAFLSGRIQFLNQKIDSYTMVSAEEAVRRWLLTHQDDEGRVRVEGGFARLARELNIGRATLYRSLTQLESDGFITKNGSEILLQHC